MELVDRRKRRRGDDVDTMMWARVGASVVSLGCGFVSGRLRSNVQHGVVVGQYFSGAQATPATAIKPPYIYYYYYT